MGNKMVVLSLKALLDAHGLSTYRLVQATRGQVAERTVYSLAWGDPTRIDLPILGIIITALETLTGTPVTPNDLLRVVEAQDDAGQSAHIQPKRRRKQP